LGAILPLRNIAFLGPLIGRGLLSRGEMGR
jgi:hypothetical protein